LLIILETSTYEMLLYGKEPPVSPQGPCCALFQSIRQATPVNTDSSPEIIGPHENGRGSEPNNRIVLNSLESSREKIIL
jgi:hypothetical protein